MNRRAPHVEVPLPPPDGRLFLTSVEVARVLRVTPNDLSRLFTHAQSDRATEILLSGRSRRGARGRTYHWTWVLAASESLAGRDWPARREAPVLA